MKQEVWSQQTPGSKPYKHGKVALDLGVWILSANGLIRKTEQWLERVNTGKLQAIGLERFIDFECGCP